MATYLYRRNSFNNSDRNGDLRVISVVMSLISLGILFENLVSQLAQHLLALSLVANEIHVPMLTVPRLVKFAEPVVLVVGPWVFAAAV